MAEMQNPNTDGDSTVLCGANSYVEKYYLNEQFSGLPESIKQELQIMCVMYTEDIGGIILLEFMPDGRLQFKVEAEENDYLFDEIGSALKIKQYQAEKRELLEKGKTNRVVAYKHGEFLDFDIQEALNMKKDIPEDQYEISKLLIR